MNKNSKTVLAVLAFLSLLGLTACKKDVNCANAEFCVYNNTNDTVYYSWDNDFEGYTDSLLPHATACHFVGKVKIQNNIISSVSITQYSGFFSDHGDVNEQVTTCHQTYELEE